MKKWEVCKYVEVSIEGRNTHAHLDLHLDKIFEVLSFGEIQQILSSSSLHFESSFSYC